MISNRTEYAYYKGCSLEGTAIAFDMSLKLVMAKLGINLKEPDDWSCCGSTPAHAVDHILAGALAARNLSIIERMGQSLVAVPCPSCLSALKKAHGRMVKNKVFRQEVNSLLDTPYDCTVTAKSALQIIYEDVGLERIAIPVTMKIPGLKVAPYYGCLFNRPFNSAKFDDPENPVCMDSVLQAVGVEVVDYNYKLECCGSAFGLPKRETVLKLASKVLLMAEEVGANCIAVTCPLCQQNLDLRQSQVNAAMGTSFHIPILYFTQIMGLAYGISPKDLGVYKNVVSADSVIAMVQPMGHEQEDEGRQSDDKIEEGIDP
jgi:heterodisulfide reductase subunit B